MVSMLAVPVPLGTTLYQIVFERPVTKGICAFWEHGGVGSLVSVVAPELSFVSVKLVDVMLMAFAKLSFAVKGATTTNVGKVTVDVETVVPPPSGFMTTTELEAKPVPVTVICVAAAFTCALAGVAFVIVGGPSRTVKVSWLLVAAATLTVTFGVPAPLTSEAGIVAVICESLTGLVV